MLSTNILILSFEPFQMRPYIVQVLNAHGIPLDSNIITVILGLLGIFANIVLLSTVRLFGKRRIFLYSMVITFFSCFGLSKFDIKSLFLSLFLICIFFSSKLGIYGFKFFPSGWSSFEPHSNITSHSNSEYMQEVVGNYSYFALAMFLIMQFFICYGVSSIPNIMMSEVFPFK